MTFRANAPPQRRMCPCVLISFQLSAQNHHLACPSFPGLFSEEFSTEGRPKCGSVGARWLIKASSNTQNCVLFFSKEVRPTIGYLNTSRSHRFEPEKSCRDLAPPTKESSKALFAIWRTACVRPRRVMESSELENLSAFQVIPGRSKIK